ncbi:MAG: diguanylate cyclase [Filomicrobium sp.]
MISGTWKAEWLTTPKSSLVKFRREFSTILYLLVVLIAAGYLINLIYFSLSQLHNDLRTRDSVHLARAYLEAMDAVKKYYADVVVPRAKLNDVEMTHEYHDHPKAMPVPGTLAKEIGLQLKSEDPSLDFSLFSNYPFARSRSKRDLSGFQIRALKHFAEGKGNEYIETQEKDGWLTVKLSKPIYMSTKCVTCHNNHAHSPKTDWQIGDIRGASSFVWTRPPVSFFNEGALRWPLVSLVAAIFMAVGMITFLFRSQSASRLANNVVEQNSQLQRASKQISKLAYTDGLTGLANRRAFEEKLDELRAFVQDEPDFGFSLMIIDLCKFKRVNDTHGHLVGDNVIRETAKRLREVVPKQHHVARLGGDEFAVLLGGQVDRSQVGQLAEDITTALAKPIAPDVSGAKVELTSSGNIGISSCTKSCGNSERVVGDADLALYDGKANGRMVTFYRQAMSMA